MAVTIFDSSQTWGHADRGLQFFGRCSEAQGEYATQAELLYGKRFQAFAAWKAAQRPGHLFRYHFYRFVPREVKILDEGEFGGGVFVSATLRFLARNGTKESI